MAEKKNQVKIRETKQNIFNALKSIAPELFGDKTYEDVLSFSDDTSDTSKMEIIFNEE